MRKPFVIHPIFFAIHPILTVYAYQNNVFQVDIGQVTPLIAISIIITVILWAICGFILKDRVKSGLLVSLLLFLFFSYGHFYHSIRPKIIFLNKTDSHIFYLILWLILFIIFTYLILKKEKHLTIISNCLNVIIISMMMLVVYRGVKINYLLDNRHYKIEAAPLRLSPDITELPDIYYIILDGYANSNVLKEHTGFDNSPFIDYLTQKGFVVIHDGRNNYQNTHQSLRSSMNMDFLQKGMPDFSYNLVMYHLKHLGYKIAFLKGGGDTKPIRLADVNDFCGGRSEFDITVLDTTVLTGLKQWIKAADYISAYQNRILCTFEKISQFHKKYKDPVFVFAHIVSPHPPFVFGKDAPLSIEQRLAQEEFKKNLLAVNQDWNPNRIEIYFNQLSYLNKKMQEIIEDILSTTKSPPVIIVQSDHGFQFSGWDHKKQALVTELSEVDEKTKQLMIRERSHILNAFYLPVEGRDMLYPSITPVNSFRVVFNALVNAGYDLLEDRVYWYDGTTDVTDMN